MFLHSPLRSKVKLSLKLLWSVRKQQPKNWINPHFYPTHNVWKLLKMSHFNLEFLITFCLIKSDLSGSTVWPQALGFQKLAKIERFGTFYELLSTQNVNIARFARNVEWDFFCVIFKHRGPTTQQLQNQFYWYLCYVVNKVQSQNFNRKFVKRMCYMCHNIQLTDYFHFKHKNLSKHNID